MSILNSQPPKPSLRDLVDAVAKNGVEDALSKGLNAGHWEILGPYLQSFTLAPSQMLIAEGAQDRALYFLQSGSLSVHYQDSTGRVQLAIVRPGSAVGEGSFFSQLPRSATVQAASECTVWNLTYIRFVELSQKHPRVALALCLALGAMLAKRLADRHKRRSVT